jgi:hypothetical protein
MNSTRQRGFSSLTTSFTSFNSTATPGGSKTICPRQAKVTPHEDECVVGAAFVRAVAGDTVGMPLEIPPLLDVILTLSAMLGLFAYVYRLAGKEDRKMRALDEIKRMNSDATVTPHKRSARVNCTPRTP